MSRFFLDTCTLGLPFFCPSSDADRTIKSEKKKLLVPSFFFWKMFCVLFFSPPTSSYGQVCFCFNGSFYQETDLSLLDDLRKTGD